MPTTITSEALQRAAQGGAADQNSSSTRRRTRRGGKGRKRAFTSHADQSTQSPAEDDTISEPSADSSVQDSPTDSPEEDGETTHRPAKRPRTASARADGRINGAKDARPDGAGVQPDGPSEDNKGRRLSLTQAARDPRDEYASTRKKPKLLEKKENARGLSPVIDFDGLSRPSVGTRERLEESPEQAAKRMERLQGAVRTMLECVGEDPDRAGLLDTPSRFAKAMLFFTKGYQENVRDIVNNAIFHEGHDEMVICKDIEVFSLCEHHLVPFTGKMHIGYIPSSAVIGLSKLPRIAEMFSRRLQIQERLTREVATAVMEVLKPQGVAVVMESSHLCMVMRGVQKTGSTTITSCVLGCFETKSKTRNEFMSLVGVNR